LKKDYKQINLDFRIFFYFWRTWSFPKNATLIINGPIEKPGHISLIFPFRTVMFFLLTSLTILKILKYWAELLILNTDLNIFFESCFSRLFIQITKRSSSESLNKLNMTKERKNGKNNWNISLIQQNNVDNPAISCLFDYYREICFT